MAIPVRIDVSRSRRPVLGRSLPGLLLLMVPMIFPAGLQAQGPGLAAKGTWASGEDMGAFFGVVGTLRPPDEGIVLSLEWARRGGLRLIALSLGYQLRLLRAGENEVYFRPAVGATEVRRNVLPKRLLALSGDLEVSRPLFGLRGWRGFLGFSGSANLSLKKRNCVDCSPASYEDGFSAVGVSLGVMRAVR